MDKTKALAIALDILRVIDIVIKILKYFNLI
jgi:hypothetical protein